VRYVWDPKKADANQKKHGILFEEAVTAFADRSASSWTTASISTARFIGACERERTLVTVFVERDENVTRIISARLASRSARRRYEEGE
jgi:uncharacterized protein